MRRKCLENLSVVGGISLSTEIVNEIAKTKDLYDLFDVLCRCRPYWNWMNIRVLEKMAGNSKEANELIDHYKEEVFSRKVRDVMSEISNLEVPTDKHTEVKEKWNKEFDDLLLRDILKRWNEIEKLLEAEGKMLFKNITSGCVEICWLLPDNLVEHAIYFATFHCHQPVEHKGHSANTYQEFFSGSLFLKIGVVIIKDSITSK